MHARLAPVARLSYIAGGTQARRAATMTSCGAMSCLAAAMPAPGGRSVDCDGVQWNQGSARHEGQVAVQGNGRLRGATTVRRCRAAAGPAATRVLPTWSLTAARACPQTADGRQ